MRERPNRTVSKTVVAQVTVGSNPTPSAPWPLLRDARAATVTPTLEKPLWRKSPWVQIPLPPHPWPLLRDARAATITPTLEKPLWRKSPWVQIPLPPHPWPLLRDARAATITPTLEKPLWRKSPWVQIPLPPLQLAAGSVATEGAEAEPAAGAPAWASRRASSARRPTSLRGGRRPWPRGG